MAPERLANVVSQVLPNTSPLDKITRKNPDDVVITLAIRTPLTKAGKGGFKDTQLDGLLLRLLKQVRRRSNLDPTLVEDICVGNVDDGRAARYLRAASLAAGFPNTTSASGTARFCGSGLKATQDIASQIMRDEINIGIAVGAEWLTGRGPRLYRPFVDDILEGHQDAKDCMVPMGNTSENVARDFDISREQQDEYAAESYKRAETAQREGWFDDEIVPIEVSIDGKQTTLTEDEGPRWGTTRESLSQLKPAFEDEGRSTAGNSCQLTDGAAALLLMKRSKALELKQPVLAKFAGTTVSGLAPRIMGIGPTLAIPKLLSKHSLTLADIDLIEINEAFASMMVYCRDNLEIDGTRLNVRGGAIALGHPYGCTGVRQIVTGLSECRRRKVKMLLTSMCLGTGMGMAGLIVNEQL